MDDLGMPPGERTGRAYAAWLIMWAGLVLIVVLAAMSVLGSQLRDNPARDISGDALRVRLFNSPPMAVLWIILVLALLVSPIIFRGLRRVGPLAVHVGGAMVLIGGLWGSQAMHDFRVAHLGETRVRDGIINLFEGEPSDRVEPLNRLSDLRQPAYRLPFKLNLNNFWLDLYEPNPKQWRLYVPVEGKDRSEFMYMAGQWELNGPMDLGPDIAVATPHMYFPGARATGFLEIRSPSKAAATQPAGGAQSRPDTQPSGEEESLAMAAEPGERLALPNKVWIEIVKVYANFSRGPDKAAEDYPGPAGNPAVLVRIDRPATQPQEELVFARSPHPATEFGLRYLMSLTPDETSSQPGMWIALSGPDSYQFLPIIPTGRDEDHVLHTWPAFPLAAPLNEVDQGERFAQKGISRPLAVALIRYNTMRKDSIRAYNADVTVQVADEPIGRQTIRVNQPMHYAGYHFYQVDYKPWLNDYTKLRVVSDSGLAWVYAGFFVMMVGLFWKQWLAPAWSAWERWRKRARAP